MQPLPPAPAFTSFATTVPPCERRSQLRRTSVDQHIKSETYSNTQIKLIEANGIDYEIQIDFTGDYVDAIRTVQSSDMMIFSEDTFQRNSENNIISHSNSDFTFTYSNFDSGNVMPFNREYSFDYFIAFDLTPSEKLPLIENVNFTSGGSDTYTIDSSLLTYDNENNITLFGDNTNYIDFEYIEL